MIIKNFIFNPFYENTYLVYDETGECVIIDAGCYEPQEQQELVDFISIKNLKPKFLLNTHCHIDHILGNNFVINKYGIPLLANKLDEFLLNGAVDHAQIFGLKIDEPKPINNYISEKESIVFGVSKLDILFVPGHTPGSLAFVNKSEKFVIVGDVLFKGSIGRTDLPGGDYSTIMESIKSQLLTLGDDYTVHSGHGTPTTIKLERINNPFLK